MSKVRGFIHRHMVVLLMLVFVIGTGCILVRGEVLYRKTPDFKVDAKELENGLPVVSYKGVHKNSELKDIVVSYGKDNIETVTLHWDVIKDKTKVYKVDSNPTFKYADGDYTFLLTQEQIDNLEIAKDDNMIIIPFVYAQ